MEFVLMPRQANVSIPLQFLVHWHQTSDGLWNNLFFSESCGTVCESNFWLKLNYLEVAKAAQSCSAHFTALLYTEIYVDEVKANVEESRR